MLLQTSGVQQLQVSYGEGTLFSKSNRMAASQPVPSCRLPWCGISELIKAWVLAYAVQVC